MIKVRELAEHIRVLTEFERDYRRYIEAQEAEYHGDEPALTSDQRRALRRELLRRVDGAERAMQVVGKMIRIEPPAFYGGPVLTALSDQVFAHETPRYGGTEGREFDLPNGLVDTMVAALGALEDRLAEAQRTEKGLDELGAQMDQMGEDFAKELEHADFTPRPKAVEAKAERTPWYHSPVILAIGGGTAATVLGGLILYALGVVG